MSEEVWRSKFPSFELGKSDILLKTYTGQPIKVVGQTEVKVTYRDQESNLPLIIVEGKGPSLFGRNWLQHIQLDWGSIKKLKSPDLESLLHKFNDLFEEKLGTMKGMEASLIVMLSQNFVGLDQFHMQSRMPFLRI